MHCRRLHCQKQLLTSCRHVRPLDRKTKCGQNVVPLNVSHQVVHIVTTRKLNGQMPRKTKNQDALLESDADPQPTNTRSGFYCVLSREGLDPDGPSQMC